MKAKLLLIGLIVIMTGGCSTIATPLIQNEFLEIGEHCIAKGGHFKMKVGSIGSEVDCDLSVVKE